MSRLTFRAAWIGLAALLVPVAAIRADWTASGCFVYADRTYDLTGFTAETTQPVRLADFEVVDANRNGPNAILASGATDGAGCFTIQITDSNTRDVYARAITRSNRTPALRIQVRRGNQNYAAATATAVGHPPTVAVDFGTSTIASGQGGEAFNIFDQLLRGADYLAFLTGSYPSASLAVAWALDNGTTGSFYQSGQITLRDTGGYDDTVVLHEMGHFAVEQYSASDSPTGTHGFSTCSEDIRLAFDEGHATYWGNAALLHAGAPRPDVYMRSNGAPGPGGAVLAASLEDDNPYPCRGAASEVNVFQALWDVTDGPATSDASPGLEDPHDRLSLDDRETWQVMTDAVPAASNIAFEDFWDGWFAVLRLGFRSEMIDIADHVGIEFHEDAFEPNGSAATARALATDGVAVHATLFSDPDLDGAGAVDLDSFALPANAGWGYRIETRNLWSDANTLLQLLAEDGQTVLASNDNRATGDESSALSWVAPSSGTFYVRVSHAPDLGIYGSYDLAADIESIPDADGDGSSADVDCDDANAAVHPGAPELCDGLDQNCDGVGPEELDGDTDGVRACSGDCDDANPAVHPGAPELCDGLDDDCDGSVPADERDVDADGVRACAGDCDDADPEVRPGASERCDGRDQDCDGAIDEDAAGEDTDGDGVHDLCDNCPLEPNLAQSDLDGDAQGDPCDLDDGAIFIVFRHRGAAEWGAELGHDTWNAYRGDLAVLRDTGIYTQDPGSNGLAAVDCALTLPAEPSADPPPGDVAFMLVTGVEAGVEGSLGFTSSGVERARTFVCP